MSLDRGPGRSYARVGDSDSGGDDDEGVISPAADDDGSCFGDERSSSSDDLEAPGARLSQGVSHGVYLGAGTGDLRGGSTTASSRALRWLLVCCTKLRHAARVWWRDVMFESQWVLLTVLGVAAAFLAWVQDEIVEALQHVHEGLAPSFLRWTLFTVGVACAGALVTRCVGGGLAAGSGIPEVRSALAGFELPEGYLGLRAGVAKVVGLTLVLGAGLCVGKEGPFVHTSAILAQLLLQFPLFASIKDSDTLTHHIYAAAAAVGVSSTFGAPIGGVLFSIEATSSFYQTQNYWKGFYCAVCGAFVFQELGFLSSTSRDAANVASLFQTNFEALPYGFHELWLFVILALFCGFLAGGFLVLHDGVVASLRRWRGADAEDPDAIWRRVARAGAGAGTSLENDAVFAASLAVVNAPGLGLARGIIGPGASATTRRIRVRRWYRRAATTVARHPVLLVGAVALATSVIEWPFGAMMRTGLRKGINDLFHEKDLVQTDVHAEKGSGSHIHNNNWNLPSVFVTLPAFAAGKFILTAVTIALPIPCGVITPVFAAGAGVGRLFGEVVHGLATLAGTGVAAGGYAIIGASALTAGVTGSVSIAVIVFELTNQLSYSIPVLLAVIIGRAAAKTTTSALTGDSDNIYDRLAKHKGLPVLPVLRRQRSYAKPIGDVCARLAMNNLGNVRARRPVHTQHSPIHGVIQYPPGPSETWAPLHSYELVRLYGLDPHSSVLQLLL